MNENITNYKYKGCEDIIMILVDWMWKTDAKGIYTYVSPQVEKILGYKPEEVIGKKVFDFTSKEERKRIIKVFTQLTRGKKKNRQIKMFENVFLHKNGKELIFETNIIEVLDKKGKVVGYGGVNRDITEYKRVENELIKRNKEDYRSIFDNANDAMFVHDIKTGAILDVNKKMTEIFGFTKGEALKINVERISSGIKPFNQEGAVKLIKKAIKGPQVIEWHCKRKNGKLFWAEVSLTMVKIAGNNRMLAVVSDITERKKAEQEIKKSLVQQKMLADISVDLNKDGDFRGVLDSVLKRIAKYTDSDRAFIFEYNSDKTKVRNTFLWNAKKTKRNINESQDIKCDSVPSLKKIFIKKGMIISNDVSKLPKDLSKMLKLRNVKSIFIIPLEIKNEEFGFMGLAQVEENKSWDSSEISLFRVIANSISSVYERRKNNEEIRDKAIQVNKEKKKIETIIQGIGDGVFVVNEDLNITVFNAAASRMSGFSEEEALGKNYKDILKFVFESDPSKVNDKFIKEAMRSGKVREMRNHTILITKKKKHVSVVDSATPLIDENKKIVGCVVVFRDATREREIDKMKTEFVSVASHQLQTPLTSIKWVTELLLREDLNKDQFKYAHSVNDSAIRLSGLVGDLLDVSHIEASREFDIRRSKISMTELINNAIKLNEKILKKKEVLIIKNRKNASTIMVDVDVAKMKQAIGNLIDNAIKYSKHKGKVELDFAKDKKEVTLSVKDYGIGIPRKQQERLFEKFFRADNAAKSNTDGTGLGLYISKAIVVAHGGKISFKSEEKKGTTFTIKFPISSKGR